jgi:hypothetical protein
MTAELCYGCKLPQEHVYVHPDTGQGFCMTCAKGMPINPAEWALLLLTHPASPLGPPFIPGDVVECRRAATVYEGVGVVQGMSMSLEHGGGTPLYPMFLVTLTEKDNDEVPDQAWYAEVSLTKVKEKEAVGD